MHLVKCKVKEYNIAMICKCTGFQQEQRKGKGQAKQQEYSFICTERTFRKYIDGIAVNNKPFKMLDSMNYPCGKREIKGDG